MSREAMEEIQFPNFYCPFACHLNPFVEAVEEHIRVWVRQFGLVQKEEALRRFEAACFGWSTARMYPNARFEELAVAADFAAWLFLLDDQFDDGSIGRHPEQVQPVLDEFHSIVSIHQFRKISAAELVQPVMSLALHDIWRRVFPQTTVQWRERFHHHMQTYLSAYEWETENRASQSIPTITTYIEKRSDAGAVLMVTDLIEFVEHMFLPPPIYQSQEIQTLLRTTNNIVCWTNDIISLKKESARGDLNNLVLAVHLHSSCSLQEAIERVNEMITTEIQLFIETEHRLPGVFPEAIQDLAKLVTNLQACISGTLKWSLQTVRYKDIELPASGEPLSYLEPLLTSACDHSDPSSIKSE